MKRMACFPQINYAVYSWSTTAGSNASADPTISWAEGQLPSTVNDSARAMMAAVASWIRDQGGYATTAGSSNAYTLALSQTMTAKVPSLIGFKADRANTGAATLNVDGTGAYPLRGTTGTDLVAGDIVPGCIYLATWVSASSEWLLINSSSFLKLTGGTLTGALTLAADPATNLQASTKQYVDTGLANAVVVAAPPGAIMPFAMNSAPVGWSAADGGELSRAAYAALFSAIGTSYGAGNGSTTFNKPDMRGYFVRGSGTNSDGTAAGTFGAKQSDDNKAHSHTITDPGHSHAMGVYNQPAAGGGTIGNNVVLLGAGLSTSSSATGITVNNSGGTESRPKNIALLYCIKT